MKKNLKSYLVLGLTVGTLSVSGGLMALAAPPDGAPSGGGGPGGGMAPPATNGEMGEMPSEGSGMGRGEKSGDSYSQLVTDGVISQETADKIAAYMAEQKSSRESEMETVKNMTDEEKKAYFESNKESRSNMYNELVSAGIITQAEADAITAAMPERSGDTAGRSEGKNMFDLDSLVSDGVIDQTTADAMTAYMESQAETRKAEMETLKDMTEAEKKAYKDSEKDSGSDPFAGMVSAGVITQEQADAIKAAMPTPPERAEKSEETKR